MNVAKHTAGPWYWHVDEGGRVSLCTPDRGRLVVMDFRGAMPRFSQWPGIYSGVPRERRGGIMDPADRWFSPESGINHPDARLIASSPEMHRVLVAAQHALMSFALGNASEEFARSMAAQCAAVLLEAGGAA